MSRRSILMHCVIACTAVAMLPSCKSPAEPENGNAAPNLRPVLTSVSGVTQVVAGQQYEYQAVGYDPDGSQVKYHFGTWPDGKYEEAYSNWGYTEFLSNNTTGKMTISFSDLGTCYLCCHCVDDKGLDSQPHTIITIKVARRD